ncbi:MAG TPA: shikimate dehydrogenase [Pseudolysinimonas sp.]|nr:shikimate dehydrogenase [Pseudolysinimonas sp.]
MSTRLAVLGSPIAHSLSPALHRAAYAVLGLDWRYEAIELAEGGLAPFLGGLDASWRGLSLTMPFKREVLPLLHSTSPMVERVGVANTVLLREGRVEGDNTDVAGIIAAFAESGVDHLSHVQIVGAGATAASVLVAARELGARTAQVFVREPARARELSELARAEGVELLVARLDQTAERAQVPDAVISTLPGGAVGGIAFPDEVRRRSVLFDVAYDPWPSALASVWQAPVVSGLAMLLHQAIAQVRIFVTGDRDGVLPDEDRVIAAMRAAVAL